MPRTTCRLTHRNHHQILVCHQLLEQATPGRAHHHEWNNNPLAKTQQLNLQSENQKLRALLKGRLFHHRTVTRAHPLITNLLLLLNLRRAHHKDNLTQKRFHSANAV